MHTQQAATFTRPLIIAHRGASGYEPEHSERAIRLGFELGADAYEPDLVLSRDGELVVRHENEIGGTTNAETLGTPAADRLVDGITMHGWFTEDYTWEELSALRCRERLPKHRPQNTARNDLYPLLRLRDVLRIMDEESERLGRPLTLVAELKHADYYLRRGMDLAEIFVRELRAAGWDKRCSVDTSVPGELPFAHRGQLVVESFELGVLERVRDAGVEAQLVFLTETVGAPAEELGAALNRGQLRAEDVAALMQAYQAGGVEAVDAARYAEVAAAAVAAGVRGYEWYRSDAGLDFLAQRVHGISVAKRDLFARADENGFEPSDLPARAHSRGLLAYTWTLRPERSFLLPPFKGEAAADAGPDSLGDWRAEFAAVFASGVDGVFADHPDLACEVLEGGETRERA